jgi:hypothetical protein
MCLTSRRALTSSTNNGQFRSSRTRSSAHAENDFLLAAKSDGLGSYARAGEFEPTPAECDLSGRENGHFAIGKDCLNAGNGLVESLERRGFIRCMHEPSCNVAAIVAVDLVHGIVALIKFEEAPFGCRGIEIRHALTYQPGRTRRNK